MKYKLINKTTGEEHICSKVVVDGFDYYASDDKIIVNDWYYTKAIGSIYQAICFPLSLTDAKKLITTNNPNIDLPKVIDEVEQNKYDLAHKEYPTGKLHRKHTEQEAFLNGWNYCLKSQETHSFSDDDMADFGKFCGNWGGQLTKDENVWLNHFVDEEKTTKELLQLWKEQQLKTLYYT